MGLRSRRGSGFTLIELLVVIVIILLIAALLLPAILKALCTAKQGAATALVNQLSDAAQAYQLDYAVYPPGVGDGTKDLVSALSKSGPKKQKYFELQPDMLNGGNIINPVHADNDPPVNIIYYRLNQKTGSGSGSGGGGGAGNQPPVMSTNRFDIWCAGCDYVAGNPTSLWSVHSW